MSFWEEKKQSHACLEFEFQIKTTCVEEYEVTSVAGTKEKIPITKTIVPNKQWEITPTVSYCAETEGLMINKEKIEEPFVFFLEKSCCFAPIPLYKGNLQEKWKMQVKNIAFFLQPNSWFKKEKIVAEEALPNFRFSLLAKAFDVVEIRCNIPENIEKISWDMQWKKTLPNIFFRSAKQEHKIQCQPQGSSMLLIPLEKLPPGKYTITLQGANFVLPVCVHAKSEKMPAITINKIPFKPVVEEYCYSLQNFFFWQIPSKMPIHINDKEYNLLFQVPLEVSTYGENLLLKIDPKCSAEVEISQVKIKWNSNIQN
jgi:hypothetical protein